MYTEYKNIGLILLFFNNFKKYYNSITETLQMIKTH